MKRFTLIIVCMYFSINCFADEWVKAYKKSYWSQNRIYELIIEPTIFPKRAKNDTVKCKATLVKHLGSSFEIVWKNELKNPISPYEAFVSNDGNYVITFDDWYSLGYGENVMVVYDSSGIAIANHVLHEISPIPTSQLKQSVTSIWWFQGVETYSKSPIIIEILILDSQNNIHRTRYNLEETKFEKRLTTCGHN